MIQVPSWWDGASFSAKASWLVFAHHAPNFSAACSMLAKMRKPKRAVERVTVENYQQELAKRGLD